MSLNGTIETFALPDVLALLSATKKTGELKVNGGRGDSRVWLDKGEMIGADVPRATSFVDALFEMLRLTSGEFAFENDRVPASPSGPMAVEPLLLEAQSRLSEWKSIEAVVPSLACAVKLAAEVSGAQVSVTAEQWRTLVAVATNPDVEGVMGTLGLGEFDSCRMLKDLVQIGLVAVDDAPPAGAEAGAPETGAPETGPQAAVAETETEAPTPAHAPAAAAVGEEPRPEHHTFQTPVRAASAFKPPGSDRPAFQPPSPSTVPPRRVSGSTLVAAARSQGGGDEDEAQAPARSANTVAPAGSNGAGADVGKPVAARAPRPAEATALAVAAKSPAQGPVPEPGRDDDDQDPAELVHQLAQLQNDHPSPSPSPRPAAEPAAAAAEETPGTGAGKGEEPLNRGLLLKFLNSVRS